MWILNFNNSFKLRNANLLWLAFKKGIEYIFCEGNFFSFIPLWIFPKRWVPEKILRREWDSNPKLSFKPFGPEWFFRKQSWPFLFSLLSLLQPIPLTFSNPIKHNMVFAPFSRQIFKSPFVSNIGQTLVIFAHCKLF